MNLPKKLKKGDTVQFNNPIVVSEDTLRKLREEGEVDDADVASLSIVIGGDELYIRIETNEKGVSCIYVEAKINKKQANRCPICGRKCPGYDKGSNKVRRWRALDIGGLLLFIETSQARIYCDDH